MKNNHPEDFFEFYQELPIPDYLTDIEIQDEYEKPNDSTLHGLSDEQVSQIAIDSLSSAKLSMPRHKPTENSNQAND